MEIKLHQIKVRELVKGYCDNNEDGVRAYGGRLDVRPPYQREFVYKDKQRDAVIETLTQGFPLNVTYMAETLLSTLIFWSSVIGGIVLSLLVSCHSNALILPDSPTCYLFTDTHLLCVSRGER